MLQFSAQRNNLSRSALVIVDMQNDFIEGGALAVPESKAVIRKINELLELQGKGCVNFELVVYTRDWHPAAHTSFASTHGLDPFTKHTIDGQQFDLWPTHCVQGTQGAQFHNELTIHPNALTINKGMNCSEQAYSGFGTSNNPTQLLQVLKEHRIQKVFVAGLAYDFCVGSTAWDSKSHGFRTIILEDCTRGVLRESQAAVRTNLQEHGVSHMSIEEITNEFVQL